MSYRILSALLLSAALAAPLTAGELILPLAAGTAADGTAYTTRIWITNTGSVPRRWTSTFVASGADGTKAPAGRSLTIGPGATVVAGNLAPAGQSGILLVNGAPQLVTTARLEAAGKDGALRAAAAGPLVSGREITAGHGTLQLHGLSHKQGGLITDLYLVNTSTQPAQCTVSGFRDDGSRTGADVRSTVPPLSMRVLEKVLPSLGANSVDEARVAVSCDQNFYAYARVAKPGSGELNVMTPPRALGRDVSTAAGSQ
jgi:hypothetical protein